MKKYLVVTAAIAIVIAMVGGAWAAGGGEVTVSATVENKCAVTSGTAAIDFTAVDGLGAAYGPVAISSNALVVKCTKKAPVSVTITSANLGKLSDGATTPNYIAYTLGGDTGGLTALGDGFAAGSASVLAGWNLTASIASGALDLAPAGSYSDILTVTVAP